MFFSLLGTWIIAVLGVYIYCIIAEKINQITSRISKKDKKI